MPVSLCRETYVCILYSGYQTCCWVARHPLSSSECLNRSILLMAFVSRIPIESVCTWVADNFFCVMTHYYLRLWFNINVCYLRSIGNPIVEMICIQLDSSLIYFLFSLAIVQKNPRVSFNLLCLIFKVEGLFLPYLIPSGGSLLCWVA